MGSAGGTWRTGAVPPPRDPVLLANIAVIQERHRVFREHRDLLAAVGSQIVFASQCRVPGFEDCSVALVRFSGAIESAFGLTREVMIFYTPYADLQIRTLNAIKRQLEQMPREVTPDIALVWSPDTRSKEKLEDWSSTSFLLIPMQLAIDNIDGEAVHLVRLLRDYIFARDLYYETTPVSGARFFGRRPLLQSLRDDVRDRRVAGVFGLRKAGKTSVLAELASTLAGPDRIFILRDLESLPSPPDDPVPDLMLDLRDDLLRELGARRVPGAELAALDRSSTIPDCKRALRAALLRLAAQNVSVVLALDEIEYLLPADRIDVREGDMASVAQFLGVLRSVVQETDNFTFLMSGLTSAIVESGRLYGRPNPLFSWAKAYFLSPFSRLEADDLATSIGYRMGIEIEPGALEALHEATGGHAFLYRHLASTIVSQLPVDVFKRVIRKADVLKAQTRWRRQVAGNVDEMVNHVRRYYPDEAFLLDVYKESPEEFSGLAPEMPAALEHLLRLGLLEEDGEGFTLTAVLQLV